MSFISHCKLLNRGGLTIRLRVERGCVGTGREGRARLPPNSEEGQGGKEEEGGPDESNVDKNAECPTNGREHLSAGSKKGGRSLQYRAHKAGFGLTRMHEGLLSFFAQPQAVGVLGRAGCEATCMKRTRFHTCAPGVHGFTKPKPHL